jgi:nuclease S1
MLRTIPALLAAVLAAVPASAWGPTGHRAVGRVAERHVAPETAREVAAILGPERLAYVGTWADDIRSDPAWAKAETWHFVTIPAGQTYATSKKNEAGDVLEAIARFERVLADRAAPRLERQQALKWLVHLVGDIHQPMHVGARDDRGGNEVMVLWFGDPSNLHSVWDSGLIDRMELTSTELAEKVDVAGPDQVRGWQSTTPLDWAEESRAAAERAYALGDRRLGYKYIYEHGPTVELRIQQAGIRLAGILDRVLGARRDTAGDWLEQRAAVPAGR